MRLVGSILPPSINAIWAPDVQAKLVLNIESYTQRYSITKFKNQKYFSLFIRAPDGMDQCCGSGSGRIQNFWPDLIRNGNKRFGSGFGSGFKSGTEIGCEKNMKKSTIFRLK